jgi:hypothetical protein
MPAYPDEIDQRLYEDALLELARAARAFATAITQAAASGARLPEEASSALVARVLDECRAAILPALAGAPGMLQLFVRS